MPDLVIEHDPDSGCFGCPLLTEDVDCEDECLTLGRLDLIPGAPDWNDLAPDACPLHTARVVQRPGGES